METLLGKNVLILGASGGIGSETARLMRQSGAHVFIAARSNDNISALATELNLPAGRAFAVDITREGDVAFLAQQIHAQIPQVDILINAAGVGIIRNFENLTIEDFDKTLAVNLRGPFLLLKHFLPPMKATGKGMIINLPGVLGKTPMAGAAAYSASKYGLVGLLQSVREELKRTNIRFTNLYLGGTDTPFWDEDVEIRFQRDKFIAAKDAARSIWFLCQQPEGGVVSEMALQPFNHQAI